MTRIYKDDKDGNPVDVTNTVTGRLSSHEPELQYLKMGQGGETVMVFNEADELPSDDLLDAMVRGMDFLAYYDRPIVGSDFSTLEARTLLHTNGDEPSIYTKHYGAVARAGRDSGQFNKAVAKRRNANKAARKARAKAR